MKKFTLLMVAFATMLTANAQVHQTWDASTLPADQTAAEAAGCVKLWEDATTGATNYFGLPANYSLISMPEDKNGISATLENVSYMSVGNSKYSGKDLKYKLIMGMNNSSRDGIDASAFVPEDADCLVNTGYLRKTGTSTDGVNVYDAIVTVVVGENAEQGLLTIKTNRGGNNHAVYVVDATKNQQVLMSTPRCPDGVDPKTDVAKINVYPGRTYYILASEKGSVELYNITFDGYTDNASNYVYDLNADNTSSYWDVTMLPADQTAAEAAGCVKLWEDATTGATNYFGLPANYSLISMPEDQKGISATLEKVSYMSVGNGKYSGNEFTYKLIMGMNNSSRDGIDASVFVADDADCLANTGYLRKAGTSADGVDVYDAIVTIEVGANAEQGRLVLQHNRGNNNYSFYVVDATKNQQVLMATPRCPDGITPITTTSMLNVYPGRKYYVVSSEKGSVELYKIGFVSVSDENYATTGIKEIVVPAVSTTNGSNAIYNLSGQKVNESYKGIVIKNGKKYLAK